jgi:5-formyltetrahydrofolate cyclo-ligase
MTYFSGKPSARRFVWEKFPPELRTPRFSGERQAAERLFAAPPLAAAKAIKVAPHGALRWVRKMALERGIAVYVPRPRLIGGFRLLDPVARRVSSVALDVLPALDAIVVGSVVLTRDGYRCGRGNGISDLEWAVLRELGKPAVPVLTIAHPEQFVSYFPAYEHDAPISFIATPEELITVERPAPAPRRIDWERLLPERIEEMPVLQQLRKKRGAGKSRRK